MRHAGLVLSLAVALTVAICLLGVIPVVSAEEPAALNLTNTKWHGPWQGQHRGVLTLTIQKHDGKKIEAELYVLSFNRREDGIRPWEETFPVSGTFKNGRLYLTGQTELGSKILDVSLKDSALKGQYKGTRWVDAGPLTRCEAECPRP